MSPSVLTPEHLLHAFEIKLNNIAEMGDRSHNTHGPERAGAAVPLFTWELASHLTQYGLGRDLLPYQVASSSIQSIGHNRHELKTGALCPFYRIVSYRHCERR